MRKRSNFRTTGISCLLSVLVALSGALSPAQASASVPTDGEYVCMTGEPLAGNDTSPTYTITAGVVTSGVSCAGAVLIPEGVTSIRLSAFEEATVLTSITIPASVTSIGEYAFAFTPALSSITFAQGSQLTSIDQLAFYTATALTSVTIPEGVTTIGQGVFEDASALIDVNFLGDAPTTVGDDAFKLIARGARANISADAAGFGTDATWNGLVIVRALPMLANGQYVCTTGLLSAGNDTSPTYTITAGVVTSGGSCAGAVLIPEGVTSIGVDAFYEATGLASITIPASVTSIGAYAFSGATGLASITIPASVTSIGQEAFYGAKGLSSISIPASVTSIEIWAICETAVTSITVDSANPNYASQGGVLFNKNLTTLIAYPSGNTATSYVVPSSVTTIEDSSFFASLFLKSITIPNSVTSILPNAFANSPNLETVTIPASVTSIGEQAFAGASMLTSVFFLGNAPTTVNQNSFSSVAPSATAYIGQSATGFGTESTWYGLNVAVLYNVTYNSNGGSAVAATEFSGSIPVAPTAPTRFGYRFDGWSATDGGNIISFPYSPTASGDITLSAKWTLDPVPANGQYVCTTGELRAPGDMSLAYTITAGVVTLGVNCAGAVLIPAGVTAIGDSAFEEATALTSISIPASVTSIGERGLREVGLTSITFAQGGQLATIGEYAFSFATSLTTITIPAGVTSIGVGAFYKATSLNSINIPSSVTSIGKDAFQEITPLAQINVDPNNQTYSSIDGVLFNEGATTLIQYPSGKTEITYTVPASVTSIGEYAFAFTPALSSITFSQGSQLTSIDQLAFYTATALTSVTIPEGVTTIGQGVFEDASALIDVNFLGNAPTYADEDAFAGMSSGATAHIKASAEGFGAPSAPWTWNRLFVQADLKEVTYNSAGGTPVTSALFTQSGSIQTAPESTRPNYTLAGWSVTENGSVVTFPYTPTADITLHAIWTSTATPPSPPAPLANLTKMAEEARARAVLAAQAEIRSTLISGKPLTVDQLLSADFKGVTSKNIGLVNADIAKLSEADKTDLKQIEKVVLKFATVDKIADGKFFYPSELIAVGLIPKDSKIKSSITSALKKLPGSSLDTFEKIQAAVASVEKKHADRKARLAAFLGKMR